MTVNIHEAKSQLSRLIARAEVGEEVVIARAGKPVAKLVPIGTRKLTPGLAKGKVWISPDFQSPMTDEDVKKFLGE